MPDTLGRGSVRGGGGVEGRGKAIGRNERPDPRGEFFLQERRIVNEKMIESNFEFSCLCLLLRSSLQCRLRTWVYVH